LQSPAVREDSWVTTPCPLATLAWRERLLRPGASARQHQHTRAQTASGAGGNQ
jgi:hypothetical protein